MKKGIILAILWCVAVAAGGEVHPFQPSQDAQEIAIPKRERLRVSGDRDFAPYEFLDEKGQPAGWNVDLFQAVAEVMGLSYEVKLGPWNEVREAVQNGMADVLMGMNYSDERAQQVDFSMPHLVMHNAIFVRTDSRIRGEDDLPGREIIIERGSIMHDYCVSKGLADHLVYVDSEPEALRLLASGRHDCALAVKLQGLYTIREYKLTNVKAVGPPIEPRQYCFAVTRGNHELLEKLNEGLSIVKATGRYDRMYDKWFGILEPHGIPVKDIIQYALLALVPIVLLMAGSAVWSWSLRKKVAERTRELRLYQDHLEELVEQRTADLAESEGKFRTIVENVPLVVYRMGADGKIVLVNHFVEDSLGYAPSEIYSNPGLWDVKVCEEDRPMVERAREECFRKGKEFLAEYRVRHRDGHIVHVTDHAIPSLGPDGSILGVNGILMDVTARVKLQEKLIRSEGLKTVAQVSARLAHEIRNPLMSAGGFARRLCVSMAPDDPNRAKVEIIVKEVGRLELILRMILCYIQPVEVNPTLNDLNELTEDALAGVEPEVKAKKACVNLQLASGLPLIFVDRLQMGLALETLLKKALSQMEDRQALSIRTFRSDDTLNLIIRYPTRHMKQDDVEHFFYPFTTTQLSAENANLPMARILVDKHDGQIVVALDENGELLIHMSLPVPGR